MEHEVTQEAANEETDEFDYFVTLNERERDLSWNPYENTEYTLA